MNEQISVLVEVLQGSTSRPVNNPGALANDRPS